MARGGNAEWIESKHIELALRQTGGINKLAAQKLGCHPRTIRNRILADPELREAVKEIKEDTLDLAEATLIKKIKEGDLRAVFYYLNAMGRERGWGPMIYVARPRGDEMAPVARPVTEAELSMMSVMSIPELEELQRRLKAQQAPTFVGDTIEGRAEPAGPVG